MTNHVALTFFGVLVLLAVTAAPAALAEPFAAEGPAPAGIKLQVPERYAVPFPPYPGAQVVMTRDASTMEVNGASVRCLPYLKLATTDDPDKVEAFYKAELEGFRFKSHFGGVARIFWRGDVELSPTKMALMCQTPNVSISKALGFEMPEAQAVVEITYEAVQ